MIISRNLHGTDSLASCEVINNLYSMYIIGKVMQPISE